MTDEHIPGQMSIYDFLCQEELNPIREVAKKAHPYWADSKKKIIEVLEQDPSDINLVWHTVKEEYCPNGYCGHYGAGRGPNTLEGWTMTPRHITAIYHDKNGTEVERAYSWADFSREIFDLWCQGVYEGGEQ